MKSRIISILLAALMITVTLFGCSSKTGMSQQADTAATTDSSSTANTSSTNNKIKIRFAGFCAEDSTIGKSFFPMLKEWQKENPDIEIVNEYAFDNDLKAKIKAEAAANSLPDIIDYWATLANSSWLYSAGLLVPTKELVSEIDGLDMSMIDESILKTMAYDGVSYGIPLNTLRMCFIVNTALYKKCGVKLPTEYDKYTYEQFREDGKTFIKNGIIPLSIGYKDGNPGHYYLAELVSQLKGGLDEIYGMMEYKNPAGSGNLAKAMSYIQEDIKLGMYPKDFLNYSWTEMHALYSDYRAASMYTIVSSAAPLMVENEQLLKDSMVVPFPEIKECVSSPSSRTARAVNWAIHVSAKSWADSAKKDAICRFLSWFFGEEWQKVYAKTEEPAMKFNFEIKDSFGEFYKKALSVQDGWSYSPYYLSAVPDSTIFTNFKNVIMRAAAQEITPDEFEEQCKEIFKELDELKK